MPSQGVGDDRKRDKLKIDLNHGLTFEPLISATERNTLSLITNQFRARLLQ